MGSTYRCDGFEEVFRERGQVCRVCLMDESDRELTFDASGRCHACIEAEASMPRWMATDAEHSPDFERTVEAIKARRGRGEFDTLLGLSGGVDSSYALVCAAEAGLKVLAMHCDTGWNSRESVENIQRLCSRFGFPLETLVVDWTAMRAAQRAFFRSGVINCDIPQDHAIAASVNRLADRFGVRTFLSGGNWSGESILPDSWGHDALDIVHLRDIIRRNNEAKDGLRIPKLGTFRRRVWNPYVRRMQTWRILNDIRYDPIAARKRLEAEFGWSNYGGKHCESIFTKIYQMVYCPIRFGFDKRRAHLSSLVISGHMSRDEARAILAAPPITRAEAERDAEYLCNKLGFSADEWISMISGPEVPHSHYRQDILDRLIVRLVKRHIEPHIRLRRIW